MKLAHVIYEDLKEACKSLVLTSDLHLLYLATPPDLSVSEYVQPNWMVYFEKVRMCHKSGHGMMGGAMTWKLVAKIFSVFSMFVAI